MKLHLRATESLAIWDLTVLPATRHKWTHVALTPVRQVHHQSHYRLSTYGTRAFSVAGPVCWNALPDYRT